MVRPLLRTRDLVLVAAVVGGVMMIALGAILYFTVGQDDDGPTVLVADTPDEVAIEGLARRSIEVLPQGQWPTLYSSFTTEYQQRCTLEDFTNVGVTDAEQLADSLTLLRFRRLEDVRINGTSASGIIIGQIEGQEEYRVKTRFENEEGVWKLAPLETTAGCDAFERIVE